jgi:PhzF family phenazine biosynthesis protein
MSIHRFSQLDVFTNTPLKGNALAVVHDAQSLSDAQMQAFAHWTNLSETTFLLPPTDAGADYRVRIFTPARELPFAGHPTLGSCHAWLAAGGLPRERGKVVQQCGVGRVTVQHGTERLAFAAPPLIRSGEVGAETLAQVARALRIEVSAIRAAQWVDNGPGWVAVMLASRDEVLALQPDYEAMKPLEVGVVAPCPTGHDAQFEVRAFVPGAGVNEDPVTGSLNAGLAQWLIGSDIAPARYIAAQGTVLGRAGRVFVEQVGPDIWVGGHCVSLIEGQVSL